MSCYHLTIMSNCNHAWCFFSGTFWLEFALAFNTQHRCSPSTTSIMYTVLKYPNYYVSIIRIQILPRKQLLERISSRVSNKVGKYVSIFQLGLTGHVCDKIPGIDQLVGKGPFPASVPPSLAWQYTSFSRWHAGNWSNRSCLLLNAILANPLVFIESHCIHQFGRGTLANHGFCEGWRAHVIRKWNC